ncbi:hypothetical protein ARMSODRAFT_1028019 [Armillaria solidipes]|uniref:Uncharacterized protein n=1 Tax=Armillaria solidipes TaxID=1076256 RepID=A0A2H3AID7_9AGAR|nr:hypothetical protein ARMSODRAFT_1028019 [Armillaria solidipes]
MPHMLAMMKETLHFHPVLYNILRVPGQDDVLPLSSPITTTSGTLLHELPVPKGVQIMSSVAACSRGSQSRRLWDDYENDYGNDYKDYNRGSNRNRP